MAVIFNSVILDSAILVFPLKLTHTCMISYHHLHKKLHSLNSDSCWWLQLSWNLPSSIQPFCIKKLHSFILTQIDNGSHLELCNLGLSQFPQKELHSFILTQLDDGRHLEFCHVGFRLLPSWTNSDTLLHSLRFCSSWTLTPFLHKTLIQTSSIWLKLIHSHLTWWWQSYWILSSWIQPFAQKKLHLFILSQTDDGSHLANSAILVSSYFAQKKLHSFILTQLEDGSHFEFCHLRFRHCHLGLRHLVIFSQIHSKTLFIPLWLWLKLIQSH